MKLYNRLISIVIASAALVVAPTAHCDDGGYGRKAVGITAGYNTRNESAVAGLYFQYRLNRLLRIAPDVTYIFRHSDVDGLAMNANIHMPLPIVSGRINFYPLAGINYTSWSLHPKTSKPIVADSDDVTNRVSKLGFNIGGGLDIYATSTLKIFIEGKYTAVKTYNTGTITAGIGYIF